MVFSRHSKSNANMDEVHNKYVLLTSGATHDLLDKTIPFDTDMIINGSNPHFSIFTQVFDRVNEALAQTSNFMPTSTSRFKL